MSGKKGGLNKQGKFNAFFIYNLTVKSWVVLIDRWSSQKGKVKLR